MTASCRLSALTFSNRKDTVTDASRNKTGRNPEYGRLCHYYQHEKRWQVTKKSGSYVISALNIYVLYFEFGSLKFSNFSLFEFKCSLIAQLFQRFPCMHEVGKLETRDSKVWELLTKYSFWKVWLLLRFLIYVSWIFFISIPVPLPVWFLAVLKLKNKGKTKQKQVPMRYSHPVPKSSCRNWACFFPLARLISHIHLENDENGSALWAAYHKQNCCVHTVIYNGSVLLLNDHVSCENDE